MQASLSSFPLSLKEAWFKNGAILQSFIGLKMAYFGGGGGGVEEATSTRRLRPLFPPKVIIVGLFFKLFFFSSFYMRFNSCRRFILSPMCADSEFDSYCLCFDSVWIDPDMTFAVVYLAVGNCGRRS